jgi:hypothetical protein
MNPDRLTCEAFLRSLDSLLSGAASWIEGRRAADHVNVCGTCAAGYRFELTIDREIRARLATIVAPEDLTRRVRAFLVSCARAENPEDWRMS